MTDAADHYFACVRLPDSFVSDLQQLVETGIPRLVKTDNTGRNKKSVIMNLHITFLLRIYEQEWEVIKKVFVVPVMILQYVKHYN